MCHFAERVLLTDSHAYEYYQPMSRNYRSDRCSFAQLPIVPRQKRSIVVTVHARDCPT